MCFVWHILLGTAGDGVVGVLDAFCPHLGAHLGMGGTVEGNALRCPFHGWEFATSGACTAIPYATTKVSCVIVHEPPHAGVVPTAVSTCILHFLYRCVNAV